MLIRRLSSLIFTLFLSGGVLAQYAFQKEMEFVEHLNDLKAYDDGLFYLQTIKKRFSESSKTDTLNFWIGKLHYQKKELAQSIQAFDKVSSASFDYYKQARFQNALQLSYLGIYDSAYSFLNKYTSVEERMVGLKKFQLASIALLGRDYESYNNNVNSFEGKFYEFKDYEEDLIGIHSMIQTRKPKSPLIAGIFSTLIPGSGKIYAGKVGQGAMSLLITGIFGIQTLEAYRKDGVKSARFIIFGGLFSSFYVANIWGSVVTVKMTEIEFNDSANEAILVNMHVPLRVIFD
jgi:TM2 domain-containing membrane protein YozV